MISAICVFFFHFLSYNILLQEDCRASELTILKFRTWTSSFCFPVQFQNSLYFFWSSIGIEITTMLTLENMDNFSSILISSLHCTFFFWSLKRCIVLQREGAQVCTGYGLVANKTIHINFEAVLYCKRTCSFCAVAGPVYSERYSV